MPVEYVVDKEISFICSHTANAAEVAEQSNVRKIHVPNEYKTHVGGV